MADDGKDGERRKESSTGLSEVRIVSCFGESSRPSFCISDADRTRLPTITISEHNPRVHCLRLAGPWRVGESR